MKQLAGRTGAGDFVGGIDNEALDFSQLEAFINSSDGGHGNGGYFGESLATPAPPTGKLLNVIVENKRMPGWVCFSFGGAIRRVTLYCFFFF